MTTQIKAGVIAANAITATELASSALSGGSFTGDVTFDTNTLVVDSSNNRVGVGTASPNTILEVLETSTGAVNLANLRTSGGGGQGLFLGVDTTNSYTYIKNNTSSTYDMTLWTNSTERMRIDSSGNVGIGTSSPTDFGSGFKTLQITSANTTSGGVFRSTNSDSSIVTQFNTNSTGGFVGTTTSHPLVFGIANAEKMRIDSSGNLGIGISSGMTYPLTIQSDANNSYVHFVNSTTGTAYSDGSQIGVPSGGTDLLIMNRESANIRMLTNSSEAMRVDSSGNVGIGTTSPNAKLEIKGAASTNYLQFNDSSDTENFRIDSNFNWAWGTTTPLQAFDMRDTSGNALFAVDRSNGRVGIGLTNPSTHKLQVSGNVKAEAYSSDHIALYNIASGSYTAGTWYDFTDRTTIANYGYGNGMYIFRIWDDTFGAGGGNYFINYLSEPFWFENQGSNANRGMEFTVSGVAMGHAANGFPTNKVRIRLLENYGGVAHDFQWSPGGNNLTLDQTAGKRIYIYLYKWGGT